MFVHVSSLSPPLIKSSSRSIRRRAISSSLESEKKNKYEVDYDKARQALDNLDNQLLSLSNKPPPNLTAKYLDRPQPQVREEAPDFSGPFLPYSAFVLLLFSIFYNVIFLTVIKPSIDFPEQVEAISLGKPPEANTIPQAPPTTDALNL